MTGALIPKGISCRASPPPPIPTATSTATTVQISTTRYTKIYTQFPSQSQNCAQLCQNCAQLCKPAAGAKIARSCASQQPEPAGASQNQSEPPEPAQSLQDPPGP